MNSVTRCCTGRTTYYIPPEGAVIVKLIVDPIATEVDPPIGGAVLHCADNLFDIVLKSRKEVRRSKLKIFFWKELDLSI